MDYGNVSFENFYQGGASSLDPEYSTSLNFRMSASQMGFPGSPQTANQLGETINALKQGTKAFEVTMLNPDTTETIPKQHFNEMRAIMKLSGVKPSVHGPILDAAGFNEKGTWEGEDFRKNNENRMFDVLEKAYQIGPEGNVPVVFHSSAGVPGSEWKPGNEKIGEDRFIMNRGAVINQETGQAAGVSREYKFNPGLNPEKSYKRGEKGGVIEIPGGTPGLLSSAEESVGSYNRTDWEKKLTEVASMNKHAEEIIGNSKMNLAEYEGAYFTKDNKIFRESETGEKVELPSPMENESQARAYHQMQKADLFLQNAELSFQGAFHTAYKYGTDEQKQGLKELSKRYSEGLQSTAGQVWNPVRRQELLDQTVMALGVITDKKAPEIYKESGDFAIKKAAGTFGNLAMRSYNEHKDKSPMLAIEPFHFGAGISRSSEMKELVERARENFADQLVEKKGLSEKKAAKLAEQKIGVTWDVGHVNMMKKYGFNDEDIVNETSEIKDYVKHIHLTDNFGYADTHLAPGMGNAPIKAMLEELEKNGQFNEMRKIIESGAFVQHFKKSPFPSSLAAFNSPIYGMKNETGWGDVIDIQGSYFGGYGTLNPQGHHSMYGAGFTTMPPELGGQMPGGASRFGGTPMA